MITYQALYCIIGKNISYSLSPRIHNFIFERTGYKAAYLKFDLSEEKFSRVINSLLEFCNGMNITIPYKERILGYLEGLSDEAQRIGAVNTVKNKVGYNTDFLAMKQLALEKFGNLFGTRALIIGAGGAAKAAAFALGDLGCKLIVSNRSKERAVELVERLCKEGIDAVSFDFNLLYQIRCDLVVNAIPVPLNEELTRGKLVIDFFYKDTETSIMNDHTISGIEILVRQALLAQQIWQDRKLVEYEKEVLEYINAGK